MRRRYSKDPSIDKSLRHSVKDGVAYSVMAGGGESYFSAFALFLKATTEQIALLASLPPLLGSFAQLVSAWLGHRTGRRKAIMLAGALLQAISWFPLALLPLLFPDDAVSLMITCVVIYFAGANLAAPQWCSLMGDLVPERRRGRYFAFRTRLASITAFTALVAGGVILHYFAESGYTLAGFILIFILAAVARLISAYHLARMQDIPGHVAALEIPLGGEWWQRIRHSQFARFSMFYGAMQFAVAIASPFFSVYLLRDLHFSYLQFMACTASTVLMQFLTLNAWGRISDIFGNRLILVVTGFCIPALPGLWLISADFWYLLVVQALGGLLWAGFSLSAGNFLYDLIPSNKRATYLAVHNVFVSIGVCIGAILGGVLGGLDILHGVVTRWQLDWPSVLYGVFIVSLLARLLVAVLFLPRLKEVRPVRTASIALIFRVVRFNPISGLIFDIVGSLRRYRKPRPGDL